MAALTARRTPPALVALGLVAVASFLFALIATVVSPPPEVESIQADSFSRSALGHRGLIELMRERKIPVVISRWNSGARAADTGVLLLLEPRLGPEPERRAWLAQMMSSAQRVLVVLPKRWGRPDPDKPGFISDARMLPRAEVDELLRALPFDATLGRHTGPPDRVSCGRRWEDGRLPGDQFLRLGRGPVPLMVCGSDATAAEVRRGNQHVIVVSEPDDIANHGLGQGDNAAFFLGLVDMLRTPDMPVIVDETLHGFRHPPSVWRELLTWPLVSTVITAVLALSAWLASGLRAFGRPLPPEPALAPGKEVLVRNTGDLLVAAGHGGWLLERALGAARREALVVLGGPRSAEPAEAETFLDEAARRRKQPTHESLRRQVAALPPHPSPSSVTALALRVHRWRQEMTSRGTQRHP